MKNENYFLDYLVLVAVLLGFTVAGLTGLNADSASSRSHALISGREINSSNCEKAGPLAVNVTEKVLQSIDSGVAGNNWAFDDYNREIKIWRQADGAYCVLVSYQGDFDSQEGQTSPGGTATLDGDEDGQFRGGYRAKVVGSLKLSPPWPARGNVGTHDYQCDINGNCPGYVSWLNQYFEPGYSFNYLWWGWTYSFGNNKWVNSSDGNQGDIF